MSFFYLLGSTNPKDGEPAKKNELEHWSDPDFQISKGKYSPAAKTLMDKAVLKYGEDHPEIRIVVLNPNMIMGTQFNCTNISKPCRIGKMLFKAME